MERDRSGVAEKFIEGATSSTMDFLAALSSLLAAGAGVGTERFEEPEVEAVESDEEDGCEGWPSLDGLAGWLGW